jgi:glycosyltransferase involved in cell wall biosynthesis
LECDPISGDLHIIFVFSKEVAYPPDFNNNKAHYVSRELLKRGAKVTWLQLVGRPGESERDGLRCVSLRRDPGLIGQYLQLVRLVRFCRREKADCVYADEWLFLRDNPMYRLIVQIGLKISGIKYVFDQRDPYIDFQIATKAIKEGSMKHGYLKVACKLTNRFTDLAIYPSRAYADESREEGTSSKVALGIIRGVDSGWFNQNVDGSALRSELGLVGRFVVGWFGMMTAYRQIEEVLIPLIMSSKEFMPDASFIIGGKGRLNSRFADLLVADPRPEVLLPGFINYADLPSYLAACDVLLCPLNLDYEFTRLASPLKILESLAVGRPIIATETRVTKEDYADLEGVIWTGSSYEEFKKALIEVHDQYYQYRQRAVEQAKNFERYTIDHNISMIADAVQGICE